MSKQTAWARDAKNENATGPVAFSHSRLIPADIYPYFQCSEWREINWQVSACSR
jgi:hypothetical protein